jgi:hypothetical protein
MDGIFINYRRDDSAPYAGRLYDHLRRTFPQQKVFMDIDAIDPGEDFVDAINRTLESSRVVLAVIGRTWTAAVDEGGRRRLDNPDDYVVRELSAALTSKARVIPVLVGGATMPKSDALPLPLAALARRNAIEVSDTRFSSDADRLGAAIRKLLDPNGPGPIDKDPAREKTSDGTASNATIEDALTTFKSILWIGFALGILSMLVAAASSPEGQKIGYLAFAIVVAGFTAWFNVMLLRGRRWSRIAYLAMMALAVPSIFVSAATQSGAEIALGVVQLALGFWALKIMFTEPIGGMFRKR